MRKSEGESNPDAHSAPLPNLPFDTKLIHTASLTSNIPTHILISPTLNNFPDSPSIEFHTATDICFEIYLQIIFVTHDIVITPSCFTTCARYIASRSNQEVVKK